MRFIPVNLRLYHRSISQINQCNAFHLTPASLAVGAIQPLSDTQGRAGSDYLNMPDFTNDFKLRWLFLTHYYTLPKRTGVSLLDKRKDILAYPLRRLVTFPALLCLQDALVPSANR